MGIKFETKRFENHVTPSSAFIQINWSFFSKRGIEKFALAKILTVSDVSATNVAFFSKDKNANV